MIRCDSRSYGLRYRDVGLKDTKGAEKVILRASFSNQLLLVLEIAQNGLQAVLGICITDVGVVEY
jgi:hypothetical protein